jgi:hypothetical protein
VIILAGAGMALLSVAAMFVCYYTIRGIKDARRQTYYIRRTYRTNWQTRVEGKLGLPRPFGSRHLYVGQNNRISRWWGDNIF